MIECSFIKKKISRIIKEHYTNIQTFSRSIVSSNMAYDPPNNIVFSLAVNVQRVVDSLMVSRTSKGKGNKDRANEEKT